jgi:hypothetical protein
MARRRHQGRIIVLRVHREIGFGPPTNNVEAHVVVRLDTQPTLFMGFPLTDDGNLPVHEAWLDMLHDAFIAEKPVLLETDFDTTDGTNGVVRMMAIGRPQGPFGIGEIDID